jgi:hypothetical protein
VEYARSLKKEDPMGSRSYVVGGYKEAARLVVGERYEEWLRPPGKPGRPKNGRKRKRER